MTARAAKLQQVRHDCLMEHHDCTVGGLSCATPLVSRSAVFANVSQSGIPAFACSQRLSSPSFHEKASVLSAWLRMPLSSVSEAREQASAMDSFGLHIAPQDSVDELDEDRRLASIAAAISFSRSSALAEGLRLRAS